MSRFDEKVVDIIALAYAQQHGKDSVTAGVQLRARQIIGALERSGYVITERES